MKWNKNLGQYETANQDALGTSLDVEVDIQERRAGLERGTLTNAWVRCTYSLHTASVGAKWEATFVAIDDVCEVGRRWRGVSGTRAAAKARLVNVLTQHIANVAARRMVRASR